MEDYVKMAGDLTKAVLAGFKTEGLCKKCHVNPVESYGDEQEKHGLCDLCIEKEMEVN